MLSYDRCSYSNRGVRKKERIYFVGREAQEKGRYVPVVVGRKRKDV
jgi:hypothetical protein